MSDDETPMLPHAVDANQVEILKLLRHMAKRLDDLSSSMGSMRSRLDSGDIHLDRVRDLPDRVTRLEETVKTLRAVVYGCIGIAGLIIIGKLLATVVES